MPAARRACTKPSSASTGANTSGPGATLACDCSGGNESIRHTIYGSQLLKDAVCDSLREATGERPNIKPERPDVLLHLHVEGPTALVSVDFSGESLHRRGYRSRRRPCAAQGKCRRRGAVARGLAEHLRARRHAPRSHVRFRHFSHRRRPDRGGCRAGARSRVFRVHGVARPRCAALGALASRRRATRRAARDGAALHSGIRHRCRCGAHGDCQRRAGRGRRLAARGEARSRRDRRAQGRCGASSWPIRPTANASARNRGSRPCIRSSAGCCAIASRVGRPRFSPAIRRWREI